MRGFAPDFDDTPTLEVPNFRKQAQELLHLLVGAGIAPRDYVGKLELIPISLQKRYQERSSRARAGMTRNMYDLQDKLSRPTVRPKRGTLQGISSLPPPLKIGANEQC